ncbi:hypothetical protein ACFSLT_04490 [Novosphingobium resinovorum]
MPAVPASPPSMELVVRDVTVRICGAVEAEHLRTVLAAIRE